MGRDHALARSVRPGEAALRLYGWTRPTVSFGRNEPANGLYSVRAAHDRGVDYVRRPTGGRAVLHAGELTYAVVVPDTALGGARATYRRINEALASALASLGAGVSVTDGGGTLRPDAGPCFREPAPGEVVAEGRKLVGSAQARIGRALLQHGSIILSGDQGGLAELREEGTWADGAHARLSEIVAGADRAAVEDAVAAVVPRALEGIELEAWTGALSALEVADARRLEAERYGRDTWTWRR